MINTIDDNILAKNLDNSEEKRLVSDFVINSDLCIGFLPKRGNASVKSMLKAYKLEDMYDNHMT